MSRLGGAIGVMVCAACASTPAPRWSEAWTPSASGEPDVYQASKARSAEPKRPPLHGGLLELVRVAEQTRQLDRIRPVPMEVEDEATILEYLSAQLEKEDVEEAQATYVALGLLTPDTDLKSLLLRVLREQVVGYYDPEKARLVVRADVAPQLQHVSVASGDPPSEAEAVLVHELVHALQDQRLGLGEESDKERPTDSTHAFRSLVEGDATLAMLGFVVAGQGIDLALVTRRAGFMDLFTGAAPAIPDGELDRAPAIVRVTLVAAYLRGLSFVADLHARGGWDAVNAAYRAIPESMEQVLHPEKYRLREAPERVDLPPFPEIDRAGLVPLEDDTLGELELQVYFGQDKATGVNEAAASGWAGDRLRVYRKPEGFGAVVWFTSWDNEAEAIEATRAAERIRRRADPSRRHGHWVERRGRHVLILRWLDQTFHGAVRREFGRFAQGSRSAW